ncbi:hypothetical protein SAMN05216286_1497 [Kosakonia oryzae]|uniref:Uncharacterized protein n=1 Tax=Kosakonia oryzae TaxID=497725 RepID=A0AA94H1W4_9ENTR|nr:hypothetical protein SAMN05216286_1497 [Kosakonia oryzae]
MMNPEENFLHVNNQLINLLVHYFIPVLHIFYHYVQDCFIF